MKKKIVTMLLLSTLLISGCSSVPSDSDANNEVAISTEKNTEVPISTEEIAETTESETEAPEEDTPIFAINEEATLNDWTIVVTSAEITDSIQESEYFSFNPSDGNKFLSLNVTVTNNGTESDTFLPSVGMGDDTFTKLYYQTDYEYTSTVLMGYSNDLHNKAMNPLTTESGVVAFELPDSVADSTEELIFRVNAGKKYVNFKVR